jgi:ATP-dependent DNA helicase RecG
VQIEATVTACEVTYRPRRQLLVTVDDGTTPACCAFSASTPRSKRRWPWARAAHAGEVKGGFLGWTMMHPSFRAAGGELPTALTPVYPTVAGLPQPYLRKAVLGGLARADLSDTFPGWPPAHQPGHGHSPRMESA